MFRQLLLNVLVLLEETLLLCLQLLVLGLESSDGCLDLADLTDSLHLLHHILSLPVLETVDDFDAIFGLLILSHEVDIGRVGWLLLVDELGDV